MSTFRFKQVLNIGLNTNDGGLVNEENLIRTIHLFNQEDSGCVIHKTGIFEGEELTLVVFLETPFNTSTVHLLAELFNQDCIARWFTSMQGGDLVGPNAHAWGEFDKNQFKGAI